MTCEWVGCTRPISHRRACYDKTGRALCRRCYDRLPSHLRRRGPQAKAAS